MRFDHQRADRHTRDARTTRHFMRCEHQQGARQQPGLGMSRRDQRAGIGQHQWPQPGKGADADPAPQAPCQRHPCGPGDRQRQHAQRRDHEQEWRRIDEGEPARTAGRTLHALLRCKIIGCGGIARGGQLARAPEGEKVGRAGRHCAPERHAHENEAGQRQQQRIAAHPLMRKPVSPAQPVHRP